MHASDTKTKDCIWGQAMMLVHILNEWTASILPSAAAATTVAAALVAAWAITLRIITLFITVLVVCPLLVFIVIFIINTGSRLRIMIQTLLRKIRVNCIKSSATPMRRAREHAVNTAEQAVGGPDQA